MTEEIIIDGVNVAGCNAYKDKHCKDKTSIIFCDTNLCSNFPNCYYKQLKRLEQENEKLKKANERLKTLFQNEGITDICEACSIRSAMEAYDYRKAFEEIKNIILNYESKEWNCFNDMDIKLEEISKVIDEVLQ